MTSWSTNMGFGSEDSREGVGADAGALGETWRQFAREDAAITAPPELERRVLAAWEALQPPQRRGHRPGPRRLFWAVAVACALLLALSLHSHRANTVPAPASSTAVSATRDADAVLALTADPALETETLQLVRVRMPRVALQAVGVVVSGANTEGFVEVDVVLGEDGLPRNVRRVALIR
jgi:hypothetical protein